jgi:hypothetical protein
MYRPLFFGGRRHFEVIKASLDYGFGSRRSVASASKIRNAKNDFETALGVGVGVLGQRREGVGFVLAL